jgi:hypothetical protein
MRRLNLRALALVSSLGITGVAGVARAGCCDDALSCLGAVLSAGVSCQIQSLIDAVNAMKTLVETVTNDLRTRTSDLMNQASHAVTDATNDIKQAREQAIADLQKAFERAHEIANPPKSTLAVAPLGALAQKTGAAPGAAAVAPGAQPPHLGAANLAVNTSAAAAPKPADPQAIKDALSRAEAYLSDLRSKTNTPAQDVAHAEQAALGAAASHFHTAQQISLDLALTPLNLLRDSLLDLLTHPEHLFDPTAQIEDDIQRITAQVPAMLDRISNEITQEAMGDLDRVRNSVQQLQDSASAGKAIVDKMQKVADSKLQSDLDALNHLVPQPPPGVALARSGLLLPSTGLAVNRQLVATALLRADPAKHPFALQQRAAVTDIASKWQTIKVRIKTPVQLEAGTAQKVDRDFNAMFAGKSKTDADKKKQELLEEANKRFAKDPKTLEKVRAYIETHAPKG